MALILLGEFLQKHGIVRVAMAATGVYWVPLHDHLDKCGFSPLSFLKLVSELGTDLSRWKDEKHFTS